MKNVVSAITFYCILPFLYLLSLLPFPVLYFLSDCVYVLLFYVIGYRKKVVLKNLSNSFPQKSKEEIEKLCKTFYHYFCDLFLETFKTLTISEKQMLKHCTMKPETLQLFQQLYADKKCIMLVMGHYGNWEWAGNTFSLLCKHQLYVIYHPLSNKYFDRLMYTMRTRFGTKLIAMRDTFKAMVANRNEISATAFIADQTPQPDNAYWTTFLNQDTPVFWGTEKIAKKLNYPIVYISVQKIRRGYYTLHAEVLELSPAATNDCEISEKHTKRLEEDIILRPATWLWTHKRWKHRKP